MKGYVIFDARSGAHVVSLAAVKGLDFSVGEGDTQHQMQALAGMCFGLLTNATEALGGAAEDEPQRDDDGDAPEPSEHAIRKLEASGAELGHPEKDLTANEAHLRRVVLDGTTLHVFRHAAFPLACAVAMPSNKGRSSYGEHLAESLCKAFVHKHGTTYLEASARGVAKPFKKAFAPSVEVIMIQHAGVVLRDIARLSDVGNPSLAPVGHQVAMVSITPGAGRWMINGAVEAPGGVFTTTFSPLELGPDFVARRIEAFDELCQGTVTSNHEAQEDDEIEHLTVEVNAAPGDCFSGVAIPELNCFVLSTLRLCVLEDVCLTGDAPSALARQLRSAVHALTKVRSSFDRLVDRHVLEEAP